MSCRACGCSAARTRRRAARAARDGALRDILPRRGAAAVRSRGGAAALLLVRSRARGVLGRARKGRHVCDGALGDRTHLLRQPVRRESIGGGPGPRARGDSRRARGQAEDGAGARVPLRRGGAVQRLRDQGPARTRRRIRAGDGTCGQGISRRQRSHHLLRACARAERVAHRQELQEPARGRRTAGAAVRQAAGSPGPRALHHPRL